jgi:molybdopterin-guanine dinucleotide biosynthesis protein A
MREVTGIILAGGRGSRLGGAKKALLEVGGRILVQRVLDAIAPLVDETILVDNDESLAHLGVRIVPDLETQAGPLTALSSGLSAASSPLGLVVACDMPFLNGDLLQWLIGLATDVDAVVPSVDGRLDPMHAVYRREPCLQKMDLALRAGQQRMTSFLSDVDTREVTEVELRIHDSDLRSFFNINTPADLEQACQLALSGESLGKRSTFE